MKLKVEKLLSTMKPTSTLLFVLVVLQLLPKSLSHQVGNHQHQQVSNISVIGTVFCDICSNNTFTKHSYFLPGAKVQVECSFKANSTSKEEILITVDRTTDRFGIYRVDIPPVDGFDCREGREIESFCRASLVKSSSSMCNVPGLSSSAEHLAMKFSQSNLCIYNLNALNYRPSKKDVTLCGARLNPVSNTLNSSLFFWPPFPPFTSIWPFPKWPFPFPFPFPFPSPPSFPFPFPFPFTPAPNSPSFPFPFPFPFVPPPPSLPFPFPPLGPLPPFPFTPSPPPPSFPFPFPPFPPLAPIPFPFTPSPPPPSPPPPLFPFPFPPLPPFTPTPVPLAPSPPTPTPTIPFPFPNLPPVGPTPVPITPSPPSPPPPSFPFPFPPFPPVQSSPPPPPPPGFSLRDPRTWFQFPRPTPPNQQRYP